MQNVNFPVTLVFIHLFHIHLAFIVVWCVMCVCACASLISSWPLGPSAQPLHYSNEYLSVSKGLLGENLRFNELPSIAVQAHFSAEMHIYMKTWIDWCHNVSTAHWTFSKQKWIQELCPFWRPISNPKTWFIIFYFFHVETILRV